MLQEKIIKLINTQIAKEFYSAYLYLDFPFTMPRRGLTALPTGIRSRHRKNATTPCCFYSIC